MQFVALDFETANSSWSSICAVGIARVAEGRIVAKHSWLVKPRPLFFDSFNIRVHGITPEQVEDQPEFHELWPTISTHFKDTTVIAHNASFDIGVLRRALAASDLPSPLFSYHCSVMIAKRTWVGLPSYRLNALAGHLDIPLRHHDAEDDARVAAEIVLAAGQIHGASTFRELCERTLTTPGLLHEGGFVAPKRRA